MEEIKMKLNIKAMALTFAIVFGLGLFLITWWIILFDGPSTTPNLVSKIYRGYTITPLGSLIGLAWASIDGAFGGACFAWIYNTLVNNSQKKIK
jgi:hypothetical protein